MKTAIKIWQIDENRDKQRLKFANYDYLLNKNQMPHKRLYHKVWEGKVNHEKSIKLGEFLENIFVDFNLDENTPDNFTGHSLSTSDIIETPWGLYYVDSVGFRKTEWR